MKEGWLLIDGAYLSLGIEDLKAKKILPKSFLLYTERNIGLLIEILSEKCKIDFKEKIYFTAEDKGKYHTKLYTNLRQQGVEVECRGFREKRSKCPKCGETHGMKIQAEVDVCIATKLCSAGEKDQEVVLIAGDRDFKTAIEFLDEEYEVRTWVAGFRASLSLYLISILNRGYSIYMDDILKELLRRRGLVSPRVPGVPTHPKMLPQGPEPIYVGEEVKGETEAKSELTTIVTLLQEFGYTQDEIVQATKAVHSMSIEEYIDYIEGLQQI